MEDIIRKISEITGYPLKNIKSAVDTIINEMRDAILNKKDIEIRGFGSFKITKREKSNTSGIYFKISQKLFKELNKGELKYEED